MGIGQISGQQGAHNPIALGFMLQNINVIQEPEEACIRYPPMPLKQALSFTMAGESGLFKALMGLYWASALGF